MYLAIDTQTSGPLRPFLDLTDPDQPHLLKFAGILFNDAGDEVERLVTLVKPGPEAELSIKAFRTHGITLESAFHMGMETRDVFHWFRLRARKAKRIVGHNVYADTYAMAILGARLTGQAWISPCRSTCTMAHSALVMNLPPTPNMIAAGLFQPRPPSISECISHFFGEEWDDRNDVISNARASFKIFRHLNGQQAMA